MGNVLIQTTFVEVDCPKCYVVFAISAMFDARKRKDGESFYCPSGHPMTFGESEADKLRKELEGTKRRLDASQGTITHLRDQRDAAERSVRAQRAANTKLRKRIVNGVCPCCSRTFADLARHMAGQHPDFTTEGEAS